MLKMALLALISMIISFQALAAGSVLISGKEIKNRQQLHAVFSKQLNFPTPSRNLDSLFDNLSVDYSMGSIIKIKHVNLLKAKLGPDYIDALVSTIMEAAEVNSRIILVLE